MKNFKAGLVMALSSLIFSAQGLAATFVYVSNNEDGDIGVYTLRADGSLQPGARVPAAGKVVMPMTVSPDKRFLVAGVRSKPFAAQTYSIDRSTGALKSVGRVLSMKASRTSSSIAAVASCSARRTVRTS